MRGALKGSAFVQANRAATLGAQHAGVQAVAGGEMALAGVVVDQADDEVQLDVGRG